MNNEVKNESSVQPENTTPTPVDSNPIQTQPENTSNAEQTPTGSTNVQPTGASNNNGGFNAILTKIKSFGVVPIVIAAVVVVALIAGVTTRIVTSTPKAVFKSHVNSAFKAVSKAIDEYEDFDKKFELASNSILLKGSLKADTNMEVSDDVDLELLKKVTLAGELGIDIDSEKLYVGASVKGDKNTLGAKIHYQDSKAYLDATFLDDVVEAESEEIDFSEIKDVLSTVKEQIEKVDTKTYNKILKKLNNSINKTFDSKNMKKSSGKFEVDGKSVSATKNSLILDEDALQGMIETFCDEILEDDDLLSDLAKVSDIDKGDIKEAFKELKDEAKDIDLDDDITINIWTKGILNSTVGFSVEVDEKEYFSFYKDGKKAEAVIDNHIKDDYGKVKVVVSFEEKKDGTEFTAKYNGEKIASGTIREISEKLIDLDVSVEAEDQKVKVSVYLSKEEEKKSIKGDYKLKVTINDQYVELSGDYEIATGDLPSVDTSKTVKADELDEEEVLDSLKGVVDEDSTLKELLGSEIDEAVKDNTELNSYGMHPIYSTEDAVKVLKKTKPSVLYVGSTYYSMYYSADSYNMFEALRTAQTDLNFYSHYLSEYSIDNDFKEAVKNVNYTCRTTPADGTTATESTTCSETPAIYLIKDGEVKKAFRGTVTKDELEKALKEIGIG